MTESNSAVAGSSAAAQALERSDDDNGKETRWRSTVWAPLVYPLAAILQNDAAGVGEDESDRTNLFFPLQEDVLRATVRELLILDGIIDAKTLALSLNPVRFRDVSSNTGVDGPVCLRHLNPSRWVLLRNEESSKSIKRHVVPNSVAPRKLVKVHDDSSPASSTEELGRGTIEQALGGDPLDGKNAALGVDDSGFRHVTVLNAESLTEIMVQRSSQIGELLTVSPALDDEKVTTGARLGAPRKVSDADSEEQTLLNLDYGSKDICRYFEVANLLAGSKSFAAARTDAPPLLEASISTESLLREISSAITRRLVKSFDDRVLRIFLGYKSSSLKRDRLLSVLSEYLFDVSHAMFAWIQEMSTTTKDGPESVERLVLHTLFDNRALRKIGGFEPSSLLPHALSISRLRMEGLSWEQFAKTASGQTLLRHHLDGQSLSVGQKRRGQRVRSRHTLVSATTSEAGSRSRSSSIASFEGLDGARDGSVNEGGTAPPTEACVKEQHFNYQMPDVLEVSLKRSADESWGILLSKEGEMCVVVRVPAPSDGKKDALKVGDVVLSVRAGDHSNCSHTWEHVSGKEKRNWFRVVVSHFKTNKELSLIVRRVGSG